MIIEVILMLRLFIMCYRIRFYMLKVRFELSVLIVSSSVVICIVCM